MFNTDTYMDYNFQSDLVSVKIENDDTEPEHLLPDLSSSFGGKTLPEIKIEDTKSEPESSYSTRCQNNKNESQTVERDYCRKKKFKCTYCPMAFHGQCLLTIHERKHTGERPFPCEHCPKRFTSAGALDKHNRCHTGERPYECSFCGRRFADKATLNRHMKVHTGNRPHKCKFCDKAFIQPGQLKAHMFYHTGENGFKCDVCGIQFNRKSRLQVHFLGVHVKNRPYACELCQKAFTRKVDLQRHTTIHSKERPHVCSICMKGFTNPPALKLHMMTHRKEDPCSCRVCGHAFIRKDCLRRHIRKHHRGVQVEVNQSHISFDKPRTGSSVAMSKKDFLEKVNELLILLIEKSILIECGWPSRSIAKVLESVIQNFGHAAINKNEFSYLECVKENAKLLLTIIVQDNSIRTLLSNETVDQVINCALELDNA